MNPRRGITATSAAVRRRRWSGEARRKSPQERRSARNVPPWAASAQARAKILTVCMVVKSCLSVKVEPPLAVASQTLTASHFSRGLVAWGCGRNAITGK